MFGSDTIQGRPAASLWSSEDSAKPIAGGDDFCECLGRRADGIEFPISARERPLRGLDWSGTLVLFRQRDPSLSAAESANPRGAADGTSGPGVLPNQAQLLEAERLAAVAHMANGLAHEGRNALQQIGACAEMLALELAGQPAALDLVEGVQEAESRLHTLFNEVRTYAAAVKLDRRPTDVSQIWRRAWARLRQQRRLEAEQLIERIEEVSLHCHVDASNLEQAFAHIIENALDACQGAVHVEIHCRPAKLEKREALAIGFLDNGPGLNAEQRQRIFEPFFTTKTRGIGLGMSIARRVIEAHCGKVFADTGSHGGTEITVVLPFSIAEEEALPAVNP